MFAHSHEVVLLFMTSLSIPRSFCLTYWGHAVSLLRSLSLGGLCRVAVVWRASLQDRHIRRYLRGSECHSYSSLSFYSMNTTSTCFEWLQELRVTSHFVQPLFCPRLEVFLLGNENL